ncbi:MAG TPA: VWA domain-containing protein [Candidatus Binataceae bacterium]|nr:VWA domain-containing protein [Candidatus Binataceae bacterium]
MLLLLGGIVVAGPAAAQQNMRQLPAAPPSSPPPALVLPGNQGGAGTSTLVLPSAPGSQREQEIPPPQPPTQELVIPMRELRNQPGYQQVTVTVTNPNGGYVTDLNKDDFKLYMDGQQRTIDFFRQDFNTPVSIAIIVDTSGSMQPKLPQARAAIIEFLRNLNDKDDVSLFAFSGRPFMLQTFTTDHNLVAERLGLLHAMGPTSLYDAISTGLVMLQRGRYDKRALLVVTDGMDNTSVHSLDDIIALARRQGVLIYSIGIGDPNASGLSLQFGPLKFGSDEEDAVDMKTLKMLSTESGAKTYNVRVIGDGNALRTDCAEISRELRQQYTVGFVAPNPGAGGYRNLKVDVPSHPGAEVRVRKGVDVSAPSSAGSAYAGSPY